MYNELLGKSYANPEHEIGKVGCLGFDLCINNYIENEIGNQIFW